MTGNMQRYEITTKTNFEQSVTKLKTLLYSVICPTWDFTGYCCTF